MFFRFTAALLLVVLVSMAGITLEKQTLEMKRSVSRQYFQKDLLLEMHAKLRLSIQQQTAISRLADLNPVESGLKPQPSVQQPRPGARTSPAPEPHRIPSLPLLRWQHPVAPDQDQSFARP